MKTVTTTITKYQCESCGAMYDAAENAAWCESTPVELGDPRKVVGARVRITKNAGVGQTAIIEKVQIEAWPGSVYHHKQMCLVTVRGGSRWCDDDSCEVVE